MLYRSSRAELPSRSLESRLRRSWAEEISAELGIALLCLDMFKVDQTDTSINTSMDSVLAVAVFPLIPLTPIPASPKFTGHETSSDLLAVLHQDLCGVLFRLE